MKELLNTTTPSSSGLSDAPPTLSTVMTRLEFDAFKAANWNNPRFYQPFELASHVAPEPYEAGRIATETNNPVYEIIYVTEPA